MSNLKINIYGNAEKALFELINNNDYDYDCLAIKPSESCPKNINLIIDHKKNYNNCETIGINTICYNDDIKNSINELSLKYENDSFLLKIVPKIEGSSCKACNSSCPDCING